MLKTITRNLILVLTLAALATPAMLATTSTPPPAPAVTGGDPEPTSPGVQIILVLLHLA